MAAIRYESVDWYESPRYYDILLEEDTALEALFLEAVHARHCTSGGRRVLEPACGSGRLLVALAEHGFRVSGFDRSPDMLRYARARLRDAGRRGRLFPADMAAFEVREGVDLAYCLISTFKYLMSEKAARAHLRCMARALRPGAIYVLGLHLTQYDWRRLQRERWSGTRDGTRVVCNLQSWPPDRVRRRERVRSRLVVEEDAARRGLETCWEFRTYDARELRALLAGVPELELVTTYDFGYDLAEEREITDEQLDCVLILRKR